MRKVSLLAAGLSVLALAACSETTKDVTAPNPQISAIKNPTPTLNPNGPVWVLGTFDFTLTIPGAEEGVNTHPQGKGACGDADGNMNPNPGEPGPYPIWYNSQGHETGAPFCAGGEGSTTTQTCTINADGLPGTYAFGTGGQGYPVDPQTANNENLNLHSDLIPQDTAQFVHYGAPTKKGAKGTVTAKSQTAFSFTCEDGTEGDGFISLDNFNGYIGNLFTSTLALGDRAINVAAVPGIDVHMYATGDGPYTQGDEVGTGELTSLYWFYRSRS